MEIDKVLEQQIEKEVSRELVENPEIQEAVEDLHNALKKTKLLPKTHKGIGQMFYYLGLNARYGMLQDNTFTDKRINNLSSFRIDTAIHKIKIKKKTLKKRLAQMIVKQTVENYNQERKE